MTSPAAGPRVLGLFAKWPAPGAAKTRLCAGRGPEGGVGPSSRRRELRCLCCVGKSRAGWLRRVPSAAKPLSPSSSVDYLLRPPRLRR